MSPSRCYSSDSASELLFVGTAVSRVTPQKEVVYLPAPLRRVWFPVPAALTSRPLTHQLVLRVCHVLAGFCLDNSSCVLHVRVTFTSAQLSTPAAGHNSASQPVSNEPLAGPRGGCSSSGRVDSPQWGLRLLCSSRGENTSEKEEPGGFLGTDSSLH